MTTQDAQHLCCECGRKLKHTVWKESQFHWGNETVDSYGYTGDGFLRTGSPFCSLRCGHRFAVRAVRQP